MNGKLHAMNISHPQDKQDNLAVESTVMFRTERNAGITNIRTARVKDSDTEFYVVFGDVKGWLYVLKGTGADAGSY